MAGGAGGSLDIGREIAKLRPMSPFLADALQKIVDAHNRVSQNANVSATGANIPPPPPVDGISVQGSLDTSTNTLTVTNSEILHAVHTHNAPLERGIRYITEIDTDPSFSNAHPIEDSTSRTVLKSLPTKNAAGTTQGYYLRVTPQYHGSTPQTPTVFGGLQGATKIVMGGTSQMDFLPSQAAGTARPGQSGQGLGPVASRAPVTPTKRQLSNQK